jgi:hypothetical protein
VRYEAVDDVELYKESTKRASREGLLLPRTHLESQPTICVRTSYRVNMGISRIK